MKECKNTMIWKSGIMTIELSLIMPILFGTVFTVMVLICYAHDKCIIENAAQRTVLRVMLEYEDMDNNAPDYFFTKAEGRTISSWDTNLYEGEFDDLAFIEVTGNTSSFSFPFLQNLFPLGFSTKCSIHGEKIYEPDYVRKEAEDF